MYLDFNAIRELYLINNESRGGYLLNILNKTVTKDGYRLLKQWVQCPLVQRDHILSRQ